MNQKVKGEKSKVKGRGLVLKRLLADDTDFASRRCVILALLATSAFGP